MIREIEMEGGECLFREVNTEGGKWVTVRLSEKVLRNQKKTYKHVTCKSVYKYTYIL